jgi:hypothetical protein
MVDNTNITATEIAPYMLGAAAFGATAEIVTLWCDPIVALQRGVHSVPNQIVMAMYGKLLSEPLPTYWKHSVLLPGA